MSCSLLYPHSTGMRASTSRNFAHADLLCRMRASSGCPRSTQPDPSEARPVAQVTKNRKLEPTSWHITALRRQPVGTDPGRYLHFPDTH